MSKSFFSTVELAKILGISREAVFKRIKAGKIHAIRVGRNYIISRDELPKILGEVLPDHSAQEIEAIIKKLVSE